MAKAYIAQLDGARVYKSTIVTTIEPDRPFYRAEDYHQDFLTLNPTYPYIVYNDLPKIENLRRAVPGPLPEPAGPGREGAGDELKGRSVGPEDGSIFGPDA